EGLAFWPGGLSVQDFSLSNPSVLLISPTCVGNVARQADLGVLFVAIDETGVCGDYQAAFCGKDERPPIDFVEVDSCSVTEIEVVVNDEGRRGVPILVGVPHRNAEIFEFRTV